MSQRFKIHNRDPLQQSVALSGGRNEIIYDDNNQPNWMVCIPYYELSWLGAFEFGTGPHPAFVVDGEIKPEIWIAQFPGTNSVPGADLSVAPFDIAREFCRQKGAGWHLMTNWEWSAIALLCLANDWEPGGNTQNGRYYYNGLERGRKHLQRSDYTLTGSGPLSWRHDNTAFGVADLVGNREEWVDGIKQSGGNFYLAEHWRQPEEEWPNTGVFPAETNGLPALGTTGDELKKVRVEFGNLKQTSNYQGLSDELRKKMRVALIDPVNTDMGKGWVDYGMTGDFYCARGGSANMKMNTELALLQAGLYAANLVPYTHPTDPNRAKRAYRLAYVP